MLAALALLLPLACAAPLKRATGQVITAGRDGLCLAIGSNTPANGVSVGSVPCIHGSLWDISRGSGSIILSGTNFALDAGSNPGDNGALKIWQSYPGLYQQTWYYTDDNRIAITGGTQCLDEGVNGVQTYQCTTGDTNQVFQAGSPPFSTTTVAPSSTSSSAPSSTTSSSPSPSPTAFNIAPYVPMGPVYPDFTTGGHRIHPVGRRDLCLTVQNGYTGVGSAVGISGCFAAGDEFIAEQTWDVTVGERGQIRAGGLCLDAGDNPGNGSGMKVYTCYDGLLQQTWTVSGDNTIELNNGQCLDIQKGSTPNSSQPYGQDLAVQTWACSTNGDPYQKFEIGDMSS